MPLFSQVDQYIEELLAVEDQDLKRARLAIVQAQWPDQSISPVQGKLLQCFIHSCNAKRVLELGTFGAYSTLWMAKAMPHDGKLITIECSEEHAAVARNSIAQSDQCNNIELQVGVALELLTAMVESNTEPFDMIFIDADKPPYVAYFKLALKLSRKGSIIICDNVVRNGKVLDKDSSDEKVRGVQRLNTYLKTCAEVTCTILQTVGSKEYDGMVFAVVK